MNYFLYLQLEAALVRDLVTVIYSALQEQKLFRRINEPTTRCASFEPGESGTQYWNEGRELLRNIDVCSSFHFYRSNFF